MTEESPQQVVMLSSSKFMMGAGFLGLILLGVSWRHPLPSWLVALEVFATVLSLFIFGSMKYQIHKNALTYGAVLVISATFFRGWWQNAPLRESLARGDYSALWHFIRHYLLTLEGLDHLIHADTMLFILGLTFFVSAIAQTRLLETVSFAVLRKTKGAVVPTVLILTGLVAAASGVLDGVSMIGLMIRTLVIILFLAKAKDHTVVYAVIISTIITTVCGMWLAYGEPPNLIMKANLHPYLDNAFFLRYCLPAAFGSYLVVAWNIRRRLKGKTIDISSMDILDLHTADVRFLQASRHGEVLIPLEFVEQRQKLLGNHLQPILKRLYNGEPLGEALIHEKVPLATRKELMGEFVSEDLAEALEHHYEHPHQKDKSLTAIQKALESVRLRRLFSQKIGGLAFIPFIGFLVLHALNHSFPLFWSSLGGFAVAILGIWSLPKMRHLALKEARHEFAEYFFLIPLFFSITLLQKTGFFDQLSSLLHRGIETLGHSHVAFAQFTGAVFLSAILDNNVVADFAARALHGLDIAILHLFAMAQIAGYALGGCWTHIGSAQSVVAFAFLKKEVNEHFTPFQWIKAITAIIFQLFVFITVLVYFEGWVIRSVIGH